MKQAKYPVFFNIALFKSLQKSLAGFSKRFKHKQHRKHFIHLVLCIVNQGSTRLKEAHQIISSSKGSLVENLSHFLKSKAWTINLVDKIHYTFLRARLPRSIYVILDFTALAKTGKKFEYLSKVHDGRINGLVDGYNLHLVLAVNQEANEEQFILDHKLSSSKHPSWVGENLLVMHCIDRLVELYRLTKLDLGNIIHIADRGYDRKYIVKRFKKHKCYFIIRAKNKKIILKDGTKTKLYQLKRGIYSQAYITSWKLKLNLAVVSAKEKEDNFKKEKMVLITNLPVRELSQRKAKKLYQKRWPIETCNKKLKSNYGLEGFRVRQWAAIEKIISLTILAFNLSQYYLRIWRDRMEESISQKVLSSLYYLRKSIQKRLNFGFRFDFWLNQGLKRANSP